jgi:hypothetical protein
MNVVVYNLKMFLVRRVSSWACSFCLVSAQPVSQTIYHHKDCAWTAYSDISLFDARPEVGKMKIVYLLPLSLPSPRHVGDIVYLKKKGRIVRLLLATLDLWKSRGIGHDVFLKLKCKSRSLDIVIDTDRQRSQ